MVQYKQQLQRTLLSKADTVCTRCAGQLVYMSILLPGSEQHAVQVQLERLTASFQNVTEDMRQRFVVDGQTMLDESIIGTSPIGSFRSNSLNKAFRRASMGPSGDF